MLVRCPQCRDDFRLAALDHGERIVKYLCSSCENIVQVDLQIDEVLSTSSSDSYRKLPRQKTVLVADDSPEILKVAEILLGEAGFQVVRASDGIEALKIIREIHPDLVVLDLLMPKMNGFDVLKEMQQDERLRQTPVVVISGVYKDNILKELNELGAAGFVLKESLSSELVPRARRLLPPDATL